MSEESERARIALFLRRVYNASEGGASNLFARAIHAVEENAMDDPIDVADPKDREAGAERAECEFLIW